jgi:hypothetical protein
MALVSGQFEIMNRREFVLRNSIPCEKATAMVELAVGIAAICG